MRSIYYLSLPIYFIINNLHPITLNLLFNRILDLPANLIVFLLLNQNLPNINFLPIPTPRTIWTAEYNSYPIHVSPPSVLPCRLECPCF